MKSKYFKIEELIRCYREKDGRCTGCRLDRSVMKMPNGVDENIASLVENVLEPARKKLGKAITVNSGFRCPIHNTAVGGATGSQHIKGEAADLHCDDNRRLARIVVELGKYDQLIIYPTFVHVSWKKNGANRHQILKKTSSGYQKVGPSDI